MNIKLNYAIVGFLLVCEHFNQIFEKENILLSEYELTLELLIVVVLGCVLVNNVVKLQKFNNKFITLGLAVLLYFIGSFFINQSSLNWVLDINILFIYIFELVYFCVCGYWFMKTIRK